ncbi:MAG: TldD/PmbA family protein [Armatimonadota bacterium]
MYRIAELALGAAQSAGATYVDARVVHKSRQDVQVKNGAVDVVASAHSAGIGVRVLCDGAWGFAATCDMADAAVMETAQQAVEIARASARTMIRPVELSPVDAAVDEVSHQAALDPFQVPIAEKIDLLLSCDAAMNVPGVAVRQGSVNCTREEKWFASSEGARLWQERIATGAGIEATAAAAGEVQRRSYPASHGGQKACRGWELVEELALQDHGKRVATEAVALLDAEPCPQGKMDIILTGSQLALQVHETCGHPVELDRVLGTEASFAGRSFLTLDKLCSLRYGSEVVNIVADATVPGALGSFGYDDEGVPAQRVRIVCDGVFCGYLTSRETAPTLGRSSNGCMRADGWNRSPIIRMTNINLLPGGGGALADLIRGTDDGLLMFENRSWSIDDRRLNFQFGCELAYRIQGGEIAGMVRNPSYQGNTPEFWGACDAVCGEEEWQVWGVPNCGKGEPMQVMEVGHGVAPARFRQVTVGVAR